MPDRKITKSIRDIAPLNMNKLRGRMLQIPSQTKKNKKEFLIVYGQRSTLEKWHPLAEVVSRYGNVTVPDLPGFGGMSSFYKIGQLPTLSNYSDYLAAFIKLRYSRKRISIIGLSFGFVIVTKMLQDYPELVGKVDYLFSVSGFAHKDDLNLTRSQILIRRTLTRMFTRNITASIYKKCVYHPQISKIIYRFKEQNYNYYQNQQKLSVRRRNDIKTQMFTSNQSLKLDNCKSKVDLPVYAINNTNNHFVYNNVEQHFRVIFNDYKEFELKKHQKNEYDEMTVEEIDKIIPANLKRTLLRYSKL